LSYISLTECIVVPSTTFT